MDSDGAGLETRDVVLLGREAHVRVLGLAAGRVGGRVVGEVALLQLACLWNLQQPAVESVVPTLIQEPGANAKPIDTKVEELAKLPDVTLTADELAEIATLGDNTNCMNLKGANPEHAGEALADRWPLDRDLEAVAVRWKIDPSRDLAGATHAER